MSNWWSEEKIIGVKKRWRGRFPSHRGLGWKESQSLELELEFVDLGQNRVHSMQRLTTINNLEKVPRSRLP